MSCPLAMFVKPLRRMGSVTLLVLGVLVTPISYCEAQQWLAGFRGGMNASRMDFQDPTAAALVKATPGWHLGLFGGVRITPVLGVQLEMLYSQKGFDSDDEKLDLNYVELPLLASVRWPVAVSPHLVFGPVVSFELSCASSRVPGLGNVSCDAPLASARRQTIDIGITLGGGVAVGWGPGALLFDLGITQGLRDINNASRPPGWARNQVLLLSVGYQYETGGGA